MVEERSGAQGRNRTTDTAIFSRVLYQLSYLGTAPDGVPRKAADRLQGGVGIGRF